MRTASILGRRPDVGSPKFRRDPCARDGLSDPGRATMPRMPALLILRSITNTISAPATRQLRGSITHPTHPLCTLRGRRYRRLTQHSLPGGSLGLTWAGLAPAGSRRLLGARSFRQNGAGAGRPWPALRAVAQERGPRITTVGAALVAAPARAPTRVAPRVAPTNGNPSGPLPPCFSVSAKGCTLCSRQLEWAAGANQKSHGSAAPFSPAPLVKSRKGAVAWAVRQRPVSLPRSSNRTCGFPASGFPTGFIVRPTA